MSGHNQQLNYSYTFWYFKKSAGGFSSTEDFEKCLVQLGTFDSVDGFWAIYSHLARLSDIAPGSEFFVFKSGIKPMWEDPINRDGGKWVVRIKKSSSTRCWEKTLLAMIGEQFGVLAGDELCGVVVATKHNEDTISVWNRTAVNKDATYRIRDVLKETLDIPVNGAFEYKAHAIAISRPIEKRRHDSTDAHERAHEDE